MRTFLALVAVALACLGGQVGAAGDAREIKLTTTADHSRFKELQQSFGCGPEVTRASCS